MKANLQEKFKNRKIKSPDPVLAKAVAFGFKQVSKKRNVVFEYSDDYLEIKDKQVVYLVNIGLLTIIYTFLQDFLTPTYTFCVVCKTFFKNIFTPF